MRPAGDRVSMALLAGIIGAAFSVAFFVAFVLTAAELAQVRSDYGAVHAEMREYREQVCRWEERVPGEPAAEAYVSDDAVHLLLHFELDDEAELRRWWMDVIGAPPRIERTEYVETWRTE